MSWFWDNSGKHHSPNGWLTELYIEAARELMQERKQMSKETKIDWTKPIEVCRYGEWVKARVLAADIICPGRNILVAYFIPNDGTEYFIRYSEDGKSNIGFDIRNVQEPRYVWFNVYEKGRTGDVIFNHTREETAEKAKSPLHHYLHTLKVNLDTGETEKLYL
jgi:hypothetical protein